MIEDVFDGVMFRRNPIYGINYRADMDVGAICARLRSKLITTLGSGDVVMLDDGGLGRVISFAVRDYTWEGETLREKLNPPLECLVLELQPCEFFGNRVVIGNDIFVIG